MSLPPGQEELAKFRQQIEAEIAADLRREIETGFSRIRDEIGRSTVAQAERHSGYMRNWLGILTMTVTVAFVVFSILGWTRFSDITADRKQMADEASDVAKLASGVRDQVKTVADSVTSIQTYEKRVADLDQKISDVEKRTTQADQQTATAARFASAVAQQTHYDLQSSLGSGQLGTFPAISSASLVQAPAKSSIQGSRFGNSVGRLFVNIQRTNLAVATLQPPTQLEIKPKFKKWTDTEIEFVLSATDYQAIKDAHAESQSQSSVTSNNTTLSGIPTSVGVNLLEGWSSSTYLSLIVETSDERFSLPVSALNVSWP